MIGDAIQSDTLIALVRQHAFVEAVLKSRWILSMRLGGPTARLIPVHSRREPWRTCASLTPVGSFAESVDPTGFSVEL